MVVIKKKGFPLFPLFFLLSLCFVSAILLFNLKHPMLDKKMFYYQKTENFPGGDYHDYGGVYRGSVSPARMYGDTDSGRGSIETEHRDRDHNQLQRATTLLSPQLIGRPAAPPSTSSRLSRSELCLF